ncbi:stalk domain-containing protein [Hydrogenibacillus schlegelii]|nr:stalk domain-containing protein [Hydrogenibacillus schlegelii]
MAKRNVPSTPNKFFSLMLAFTVFSLSFLFSGETKRPVAFAQSALTLKVDGRTLGLSAPPLIRHGRTYVPVKFISDALGYQTQWLGPTKEVRITGWGHELLLKIGEPVYTFNDRRLTSETSPFIEEDRTYVPLRLVAESFGADVSYDATTKTVEIRRTALSDGKRSLWLGLTESDVERLLGAPDFRGVSRYGAQIWLYSDEPAGPLVVSLKNGQLVDLYTTNPSWESVGVRPQMRLTKAASSFSFQYRQLTFSVEQNMSTPTISKIVHGVQNGLLLAYIDQHAQANIIAVRLSSFDHSLTVPLFNYRYEGDPANVRAFQSFLSQQRRQSSPKADETDARIMAALINAFRKAHGLSTLLPDPKLDRVARLHSEEMTQHRYFDHVSKVTGKTLGDRLRDQGVPFSKAGENLAQTDDILVSHVGLINSPGHRKNLLDPEWDRMGIGTSDRNTTQVFIKTP